MELELDIKQIISNIVDIQKGPPGPKPARFGDNVDWDDEKHRWVDTTTGEAHEHSYTEEDGVERPVAVDEEKPERGAETEDQSQKKRA